MVPRSSQSRRCSQRPCFLRPTARDIHASREATSSRICLPTRSRIRPRILIWRKDELTSTDVHQQPRHLRVKFEGNFVRILENCFELSKLIAIFNSLPAPINSEPKLCCAGAQGAQSGSGGLEVVSAGHYSPRQGTSDDWHHSYREKSVFEIESIRVPDDSEE
jgi:hypothetical protein